MAAAAANDVQEAIRDVAANLLRDTQVPPTDLDTITSRLKVTVSPEDIFGSGELRRDHDGYKIIYATDLSVARRRFTVAHELGHVIINQTGPNAPRRGKELERLCDLIAVELLMPTDVFRAHLPQRLRITDLFQLARKFQTSLSATAKRCAEFSEVTVFEVAKGKIAWCCGRMQGSSAFRDHYLMEHISRGCAGKSAEDVLCLTENGSIRSICVEYRALGGTGRALFILTTISNSEAKAALRALEA